MYERVVKATIFVSNIAPTEELVNGKIWFKTQSDPYTHLADTPIIGTFMMYQNGTWEEMYPDTIFDWVEDKDQYREVGFEFQTIISTSQWNNLSVDISNSHITVDSIVNIIPQSNMTNVQWIEYNKLESVTVANGKITITAHAQIVQNLPIKILVR